MSEEAIKQRLENYRADLMQQKAENKRLKEAYDRQINDLADDLRRQQDESQELRRQSDERERELRELRPLRLQVAGLQQELGHRDTELDNRSERIRRLEDSLKQSREQKRQAEALATELRQQIAAAEVVLEQLRQQVGGHEEYRKFLTTVALEALGVLCQHYYFGRALPPRESLPVILQQELERVYQHSTVGGF